MVSLMLVSDFHFDLPEDLIAQSPPAIRGSSRMLCVDRRTGVLHDDLFASLPTHLRPGDLLILNDSKVLPGRLYATRAGLRTQKSTPDPTGRIEVLLTQQLTPTDWTALVRPAKKIIPSETLNFPDDPGPNRSSQPKCSLKATSASAPSASPPDPLFLQKLDHIGHMPLPPYMHRPDTRPKTKPATRPSTPTLPAPPPPPPLASTSRQRSSPPSNRKASRSNMSPSTSASAPSKPVRAERLEDIRLHTEHYTLPDTHRPGHPPSAQRENRRIIAAGTTTTRTLEHCAATGNLTPHSGSTSIFLAPGHNFAVVTGLLTNFHLPQSTLLMLVSAFLGDQGREKTSPPTPTPSTPVTASSPTATACSSSSHDNTRSVKHRAKHRPSGVRTPLP